MALFTQWINTNYQSDYEMLEKLLAKGLVSHESMPFLFRLGEVVLAKMGRTYEDIS